MEFVLLIQTVVCQLMAWLSIDYRDQHMQSTNFESTGVGPYLYFLAWMF
jgi:hypothetical protein